MPLSFKMVNEGVEIESEGKVLLNRSEMATVVASFAVALMKKADDGEEDTKVLLINGKGGKAMLAILDVKDQEVNENTVFQATNKEKKAATKRKKTAK